MAGGGNGRGPDGAGRGHPGLGRVAAAAALTANAVRPVTRAAVASPLVFAAGMPLAELPLLGAAAAVTGALLRTRRGGWRGPGGVAAAVLTGATGTGLAVLAARARRARAELAGALDDAFPDWRSAPAADRSRGHGPRTLDTGRALVRGAALGLPAPGRLDILLSRRRYVARDDTRRYAPGNGPQLLDVWRRRDLTRPAPLVVQIPGGAWVTGGRRGQAYSLLALLALRGWVCVSLDYRLAPTDPWPAQIVDVKRAIAWVRDHAAELGADPEFVAVTGGSAGGHLASLAALTPNDPRWQPEASGADTSVQAAASLYGRYDWVHPVGPGRAEFWWFLERFVVRRRQGEVPEVFVGASPLSQVRADAPPFLVVHGSEDSLIPVEQARAFAGALRRISDGPVGYAELGGAQHAFDLFPSHRARAAALAVESFFAAALDQHRGRIATEVPPPLSTLPPPVTGSDGG